MNIDHPYSFDILCNYLHVSRQGKIVNFFGFPATLEFMAIVKPIAMQNLHSSFEIIKFRIPYTDLKYFIKLYINSLWQIFSDFYDTSKLYSIQNKVTKPCNFNLKRTYDFIISGIRIGHSRLTHSYLLKGEQQAECNFSDCLLTIQHIYIQHIFSVVFCEDK